MIPIFRAFSETFDKYIVGVPYFSDGRYYMLVDDCNKNNNIGSGSYPIDETTLSIHFPDMLDSQGNEIFASLQEDGKGGDIANYNNQGNWIAIYIENAFMWVNVLDMQKIGTKQPVSFLRLKPLAKMIVTGIQE